MFDSLGMKGKAAFTAPLWAANSTSSGFLTSADVTSAVAPPSPAVSASASSI